MPSPGKPASEPEALPEGPRRRSTACAGVEDMYASNARALNNKSYEEIRGDFPMLCYCSPNAGVGTADAKLCRLTKGGHRGRLSLWTKVLWAAPLFGWFAAKYLKIGYMKKFYTDDYPRASLGVIAFSSVLAVLIDAFTDPKMAVWTDSLRTRFGRRRPFVVASAFFYPVVVVFSWLPLIVGSGLSASIWYGVFHVMYALADTLFMMPHEAWGAQLTPIYKEKNSVWLWGDLLTNCGICLGMALVPLMFVSAECKATPNDGCADYPIIAAVFSLVFMLAALRLAWLGKEPDLGAEANPRSKPKFSEEDTVPMLISTFMNRPFRILLLSDVVKALGQDIPFNVLPYLAAWVIGQRCFQSDMYFGICVMINLICGLVSLPFWSWLASRFSKYVALCVHIAAIGVSSFLFIFLTADSGSCQMSYMGLVFSSLFGAAYGGTFLLKSIMADIVEYDTLLTGGEQREASYFMALDFIPKFMQIPGECVPFVAMAYLNYARPVPSSTRPACSATMPDPDAFCTAFYTNASAPAGLCSESMSCDDLVANGVSFVCNLANGECGLSQNSGVQWTLALCFSLVPFVFVMIGLAGLYFYPKEARDEQGQQQVLAAVARLRSGESVEDPWRPGSMIHPAEPPTENAGALAYFTPQELLDAIKATPAGQRGAAANLGKMYRWPLAVCILSVGLGVAGVFVTVSGLQDLASDIGASVSPLGLMLIGIALVCLWFSGSRLLAYAELRRKNVGCAELVAKYNRFTPFIGHPRLPTEAQALESAMQARASS